MIALAFPDPTDPPPHEVAHRFREWNARQSDPMPTCGKCGEPFHPTECGDLFPDWCLSCELNWTARLVGRLIGDHGRKDARAKLRALLRKG
jgi:hypothetical protein